MNNRLIVRPDKNEFLLYAMLDTLGLVGRNTDSHFLRRKAADHFRGYLDFGPEQKHYGHYSKPVGYVLTINEAPNFSEKQGLILDSYMQEEIKFGKAVLPHIKRFYKNTDFEDFYQKILPRYSEECEFIQGILERCKIVNTLDNVWEVEGHFSIEAIPMPLEEIGSGIGPGIGNTVYPIFGPPFDFTVGHIVAHESSHLIAKQILKPVSDKIKAKKHLLKIALKQPNYPPCYHHWPTCLEEHFIRAMQTAYINPALGIKFDADCELEWEKNQKGMVFIKEFYDEIRKYKKHPSGSLQDVAIRILDKIDKKYKI